MFDDFQITEHPHDLFIARHRKPAEKILLVYAIRQSTHGSDFQPVGKKFNLWHRAIGVIIVNNSVDNRFAHGD